MTEFNLCIPTEIRFGKGRIAALDELLPPDGAILMLYGGGSIKANGVYEQVIKALGERQVAEFGGVEPNPSYETLQRAAERARQQGCDFILGVGGGSVIDAAKFLAAMIATNVDDPWDRLVSDPQCVEPLPVGAVLTLPATGSESNPVSVISNVGRGLKLPFANDKARPRFAIMDPSSMQSLSRRQLENGVVDAFTHVLEQYLTTEVNAPIQYGYSETLLRALIESGPELVETRSEAACETVMWAANQALNGLIGAGVPQDWSTHMIGHAITAMHGIDHARTLSMVMPSLLRYKQADKLAMLARYGRNVWRAGEESDEAAAHAAIDRTEAFMRRMGCPVRLSDMGLSLDADRLVEHLESAGHTALGERGDITPTDVRNILAMAA